MNQNGTINDIRDEFGDSDDNDDDEFNTLQSILSWDEGEETGQNNESLAGQMSSFRNQGVTSTELPPDMVQFSTNRDGPSQLSFNSGSYNNSGGMFANVLGNSLMQQQQQQQQQQSNTVHQQQDINLSQPPQQPQQLGNQSRNLALPLPIPMPISSLGSQQEGPRHTNTNESGAQPPMFQVPQNSGQNAVLAQILAQLQQSANNAGQQQQQQPPNMQPLLQQQAQQQQEPLLQQQAQQQQQQPQQQMAQFQFDPQALMRQLQYAQLQQQLQAAQNSMPQQVQTQQSNQQKQQDAPLQQNSQMPMATQPSALPPPPQQQQQQSMQNVIQQQLQQHFQQAQAAANVPIQQQVQQPILPAPSPSNVMMPPNQASIAQNIFSKKPPPMPKAPPKASKPSAPSLKNSSASATVSASDTDIDTYRKVNVSKKQSAKEKSTYLDLLDTSNMTPQQRAKANRDRNREHARNTRVRKKAYLEKLKATVDELCRERDTLVSERAGAANLLVEMHNTRTEVLVSFFALRTTNEKRRKLWASIVEESCFACVMPVTPYRSFPASEVQVSKCMRTVMGIDGIMADTASLHVLFDSLVDRSKYPFEKINFRYTLVTEEAVVAGNQMMARWVMTTTNAVQLGSTMEVSKQGMLCCKFNSAHKIIGLESMFDVMAFMLQLKQAAGSESFTVIPNTVQTCQKPFDKPMVMTLADPPYTIIQVNSLWEDMTGYTADEVVGKLSCSILQPPDMDRKAVTEMMQEVRFKRAASAMLMNRTKSGMLFNNYLVVYPLSTDSRITYYLGLTTYTKRVSSMHSTAQSMIGQVSYGGVPSADLQEMMMPPMIFDQPGQMPPPTLQLHQSPTDTVSQQQQLH